jgi:cell division protein FtsB
MSVDFETRHTGSLLGALSSLGFWLCLFVAAALYAAVALSSKLCTYGSLRAEFETNQWRLVTLERQVAQLRRVVAAQQHDPAFVREQAQSDFELSRPGEQRIPVDSHLTLHIGPGRIAATVRPVSFPVYAPLARKIATSRELSNSLLAAAAALVIGAFTIFPAHRSPDPSEFQP